MKSAIKKPILSISIALALSAFSVNSQAAFGGDQNMRSTQKAGVNQEINSAYELLRFQEQMSKEGIESREQLISRSLRLKAMTEYARSVAIRSGIKSRINTIQEAITVNSREFDAIYDFAPLMIEGRVIPPVISEANNLYNQKDDNQVNTAAKVFKIVKQAKFASTAPNWREYLNFPVESSAFEKYAYVAGEMQPKDDVELKAWQEATIEGFDLGVNQGNIILKQGMERLNRDYLGMVRFHQFVMQGKLSMPIINHYNLHDTNDGTTMVLDESMLRISRLPTFNDQATIESLPQHQLSAEEYIVIDDEATIELPKSIGQTKLVSQTVVPKPAYEPAQITSQEQQIKPQEKIIVHSQPILSSVQNIINDEIVDGKSNMQAVLSKKSKAINNEPQAVKQTNVGLYGSQEAGDTVLISIKTRVVNKASD